MNLFPYQEVGRDFLAMNKTAGLFDGMRMGKTRQFLMAAKKINASTVAVVAKATGVYVWEEQALEAGYDPIILKSGSKPLPNRFNIFSYNALISPLHPRLMNMRFDLVGGDESDAFKNPKAKRTKAFYGPKMDTKNGLTSRADYNWVMTGTPFLNNASELWPMCHALFPDAISNRGGVPMNYWQFVNRYCITKDNGFGVQIIGSQNLLELRDRLRGRWLRRTKEEVWEQWKATTMDLLPIEGKLEGIPNDEIEKVMNAVKSGDDIVKALEDVAEQVPTLRKLTGLAKVNGVVDWVHDNIEQEKKIIIFAHHKEVIAAIKNKLKLRFESIVGGMSSEEKRDAYMAFQTDDSVKVFIGQNQAARDSIPLWKASVSISVEPDWTPGNNDQMMDRMVHHDKHEACNGYFATLRGSIDEIIQKALLRKSNDIKELGL